MQNDLAALLLLDKLTFLAGNKVVRVGLFGFSNIARLIIDKREQFGLSIDVLGIFDNSQDKQGSLYNGIAILPPGQVKDLAPDFILITSLFHGEEIKEQLRELGVQLDRIIEINKELESGMARLLTLGSGRIDGLLQSLKFYEFMQVFFRTVMPKLEKESPFGVNHLLKIYTQVIEALADTSFSVTGAKILEVGGGRNPFGVPLIFALHGAVQVDVIDIQEYNPVIMEYSSQQLIAESLLDPEKFGLPDKQRETVWTMYREIYNFPCLIPAQKVFFSLKNIQQTDFNNEKFDLVYSNTVLEHIEDLTMAAGELARITVPGGYGVHMVDFRDHRDFNRPWDFLCMSRQQWQKTELINCYEQNGIHLNRLRLSHVEEIFKNSGFAIVKVIPNIVESPPEEVLAKISREFMTLREEDLNCLHATIVVKRV